MDEEETHRSRPLSPLLPPRSLECAGLHHALLLWCIELSQTELPGLVSMGWDVWIPEPKPTFKPTSSGVSCDSDSWLESWPWRFIVTLMNIIIFLRAICNLSLYRAISILFDPSNHWSPMRGTSLPYLKLYSDELSNNFARILSLSTVILRFSHVVCINNSFLFIKR